MPVSDQSHTHAAAERLASGTPVDEEYHGWGERTRTEEETKASELSCEVTCDKSARARSDDNRALAKAKKQNVYNGASVSDQTRDGGGVLAMGICSRRVVNCKPPKSGPYSGPRYRRERGEGNLTNRGPGAGSVLQAGDRANYHKQDLERHYSEQGVQGPPNDEAAQSQLYVRLEREAGGQILECDVPKNALYRPLPYGYEAGMAKVDTVPSPTGWCVCNERRALFYPLKHTLPWCCRATAVPNQGWLAAMAGESKLYYTSC